MLSSEITIGKIITSAEILPEQCSRKYWGCSWQDVQSIIDKIHEKGIPMVVGATGQTFQLNSSTQMQILAAIDGRSPPVGTTDLNDTSLIIKLTNSYTSILFAGDLNRKFGDYLVSTHVNLKADILKAPHHGTEGHANNAFFDSVKPTMVFVPSPKELWLSDRSKRMREWIDKNKVKSFVNGLHGTVHIIVEEADVQVLNNQ